MITISKYLLGTTKHLCQYTRDGTLEWVSSIDPASWVYGLSSIYPKNVECVFDLLREAYPSIIPEPYINSMRELLIEVKDHIPWYKIMRHDEFSDSLSIALGKIWVIMDRLEEMKYLTVQSSKADVLSSMVPACIDEKLYQQFLVDETIPVVRGTIQTFKTAGRTCKKVVYNQTSTVTGRLTVRAGPQILTLPSRCRKMIKSSFSSGKILEIDYASIEPRIAMTIVGNRCDGDIYEYISKELFNERLDRKGAKLATLCALYGASPKKLSSMIGSGNSSKNIISKIRAFFGYDKIVKDLLCQYTAKGYITNYFGRPIYLESATKHIMFNNFIQSTAVDAAMLGFKKVLDSISTNNLNARPLFLIHDAMIIDIHGDNMEEFVGLFKHGIELEGFGVLPIGIGDLTA